MRVLVVDDDSLERAALVQLCGACHDFKEVSIAESGEEALRVIRESRPAVVLLDCDLRDMSGFDVLRALRIDERPVPVMVAEDERHAVEALEWAAIDYLTKPVSAQRFDVTVRRIRALQRLGVPAEDASGVVAPARATDPPAYDAPIGVGDRLVGERGGRFYFLAPQDVDYVEADGHYMKIHVGNCRYITRDSLRKLARSLEPYGFVRISRSVIVNLQRVQFAEREGRGVLAFVLVDGARLVSGPGYHIAAGAELRVTKRRGSRQLLGCS
jgi:two-component system, LytTR family, response regulator